MYKIESAAVIQNWTKMQSKVLGCRMKHKRVRGCSGVIVGAASNFSWGQRAWDGAEPFTASSTACAQGPRGPRCCWGGRQLSAAVAGMQAALLIRHKQTARHKGRRADRPTNVATREIAPFPTYPPQAWVCRSLHLLAEDLQVCRTANIDAIVFVNTRF